MSYRLIPLALALLFLPPPLASAEITGQPRVIDGDTLAIDGQRIRLSGIDAPERRQPCFHDGQPWRCGEDAAKALARKIDRRPVTCEERDRDRYGRTIAICYAGGEDLNAWMVEQGWAMAYRRYSLDYVEEEADAQQSRRGLWQGEFMPPWEWRKMKRKTRPRQMRIY